MEHQDGSANACDAAEDANVGLNACNNAAAVVQLQVAKVGSNGAKEGMDQILKVAGGFRSDRRLPEKAVPPRVGMSFPSLEEAFEFYDKFALQQGFSITRCSSAKGSNGEHRFQTFACHRAGKPRISKNGCMNPKATAKTNCLARICCSLGSEGRWKINSVVLEHNHSLSPEMPQLLQKLRFKRKHEYYGLVIETGGYSNVSYLAKDENEMAGNEKAGFIEGDAQALLGLFLRIQKGCRDFFYAINSDSEGRLRNAFWADARSKAAYHEFSDVVFFDTRYLLNKCNTPFASFLGINHHGQLILLGCALISDEDADTYTWLFGQWLSFMSNITPSAIITDQCDNIGKAVESIFPNSRHRWCLWHILTKFPEKMNQHKKYDDLKEVFLETVYESLTIDEFEEKWAAMVLEYDLHGNDWFLSLCRGREYWVPLFVKNSFWAGISPIHRSESMHPYFDGFFHPRITVKQFIDRFEVVLKDKLEKEIETDLRCMSSSISCATTFGVEKQFQVAYTNNMFAHVQKEVTNVIYCEADLTKVEESKFEYEVQDKVNVTGGGAKHQILRVLYDGGTGEVECDCRLFEFKGILCRHAFHVLIKRDVALVPSKYVLRRWRKDVRRCYNKIAMDFVSEDLTVESKRLRKLEKIFYTAADLATETTEKYEFLMKLLQEGNNKLEKWQSSCDSSLGESSALTSGESKLEVAAEGDELVRSMKVP